MRAVNDLPAVVDDVQAVVRLVAVAQSMGRPHDQPDSDVTRNPPNAGELAHYGPGDQPTIWDINGVRCGALICYEYRYPELHRDYKRLGARIGPDLARVNQAPSFTYPGITMPAAMTPAAASSHRRRAGVPAPEQNRFVPRRPRHARDAPTPCGPGSSRDRIHYPGELPNEFALEAHAAPVSLG